MDPFSSLLPYPVVGKILGSLPLKNLPFLRKVCKGWNRALKNPEVWIQILCGVNASDCRWVELKKIQLLRMKDAFADPQLKITFFIADTINKGIFFPPYADLEESLINHLSDHRFITQSISLFNTAENVAALDQFLTGICLKIKKLRRPADRNWTLPQVLIKNGFERSFLTVIGLIENCDMKTRDPLGHDLLYWALSKKCSMAVMSLLECGVVIRPEHITASAETNDISQLTFIVNRGEKSLTTSELFDVCKNFIEHHPKLVSPVQFLLNYCQDKFTGVQFNELSEVAYKAQSIGVLEILIRQYRANVNFMEMLNALHTTVYPEVEQDKLDNLLYDIMKINMSCLKEFMHFNLVYYLASLGALKTFALIFPRINLESCFVPGQRTPLHAACAHMQVNFAKALIVQRDGECSDIDDKGNSVWHLAFEGYKEIDEKVIAFIRMMLEAKGNLYVQNREGYTPLDLAQMNLGNAVLKYFPTHQDEVLEITGKDQFTAPLWIVLPRMANLRSFTAHNKEWFVKCCSESDNACQLQDMTNVNRHAWALPTVNEVNVSKGKFFAYSWIHLFKSFPKAAKIDFSFCKFTTYDPFQDQIKFLESLFKEMKREKCRVNLQGATFHDKPIIFTPKQLAIFKQKFPWLTIDGDTQTYKYTVIDRDKAHVELMKDSTPAGSFILHPSNVRDMSGQIPCDEVSFKSSTGKVATHLVRIHPIEDFVLHYRGVTHAYDNIDIYANLFVFLNVHNQVS